MILHKFKIEANIYLLLEHPNIVNLKNFIIKNGNPHLVQEYIDGVTIEEYMNFNKLTDKDIKNILIELIRAVKCLNYQNIYHLLL